MDTLDQKLDIAFVCIPETGHLYPLLYLLEALSKAGHRTRLYTLDVTATKWGPRVEAIGGTFCGIPSGLSDSKELVQYKEGKSHFKSYYDLMSSGLTTEMKKHKPHVIVADFTTVAAFDTATELGVPLAVNCPGPSTIFRQLLGLPGPMMSVLGGSFMIHKPSMLGVMVAFGRPMVPFEIEFLNSKARPHLDSALLLVNSFFPLEAPALNPPSFKFVGSMCPLPEKRMPIQDAELSAFLERAGAEGVPVVYISTGSMLGLHPFQIQAMFQGLSEVNCFVIWSLRNDLQQHLPTQWQSSGRFYVSGWLPQAALLSHPSVKLCVSHCGWGGTMELIAGGVTVVAIPFSGDQPDNAAILQAAGCGEILCEPPVRTFDPVNTYRPGSLTPQRVTSVVSKVLSDPTYRASVLKMQQQNFAAGGAAEAARLVERYALAGGQLYAGAEFKRYFLSPDLLYARVIKLAAGLVLGFGMYGLYSLLV